jgi:hypothetical protein
MTKRKNKSVSAATAARVDRTNALIDEAYDACSKALTALTKNGTPALAYSKRGRPAWQEMQVSVGDALGSLADASNKMVWVIAGIEAGDE